MVKKPALRWLFYRPRVLPDDGCGKAEVERKYRNLLCLRSFFRTTWFQFRHTGFVKEQQKNDQIGTIPSHSHDIAFIAEAVFYLVINYDK
jgi:hypothetical protein